MNMTESPVSLSGWNFKLSFLYCFLISIVVAPWKGEAIFTIKLEEAFHVVIIN